MVKKSVLVFVLLLAAYNLFVVFHPMVGSSQHQWQDNVIKAQKYIYDQSDTLSDVMVGTSHSCVFVMDSLPSFCNLSFGGLSIFDGLSIIKKKDRLPKSIYIETNVLLRQESDQFTASLFEPIPYYLAMHLACLRADKQPFAVFISYLNAFINRSIFFSGPKQTQVSLGSLPSPIFMRDDFFTKMLRIQVEDYSKIPDKKQLSEKLALLERYVHYFSSKGVKVYFYEMPVNRVLEKLPKALVIREEMHKVFPPDVYNYLTTDTTSYKTIDGIHLNKTEAIRYTRFFRSGVELAKNTRPRPGNR